MKPGYLIKRLREARHWSQEELAHRANSTAANICRLESERHAPSLGLFGNLASAFGMKPHQLMALAEGIDLPELPIDALSEEMLLQRLFADMTPDQKSALLAVARQFVTGSASNGK